MSATSLPLSGKGHQTVIAGHRGGYTSPQFLYVDQLVAGDHIYIDYLGEKQFIRFSEQTLLEITVRIQH